MKTRVTEMLGIEKPIIQAAMGWIARSQLSSAVSNAGGMGIIETSSGELDAVRAEIVRMRALTDKPFGVNVAQAFVRDPSIVQFVIDQGVRFVTTSAGDPMKYTAMLKDAGLTVFHVVPNLAGALRAVEAGVDGLIVEGGEGGGFKNAKDVSTMVLVPQVVAAVDVPVPEQRRQRRHEVPAVHDAHAVRNECVVRVAECAVAHARAPEVIHRDRDVPGGAGARRRLPELAREQRRQRAAERVAGHEDVPRVVTRVVIVVTCVVIVLARVRFGGDHVVHRREHARADGFVRPEEPAVHARRGNLRRIHLLAS